MNPLLPNMSDTSQHLTPNSEESLELEYQLRITKEINDQKDSTPKEKLFEQARFWAGSKYRNNVPGLWLWEEAARRQVAARKEAVRQEAVRQEAARQAEEKKKREEAEKAEKDKDMEMETEKQT